MNNQIVQLEAQLKKETNEQTQKLIKSFRDLLLYSQITIYDNQDESIYEDLLQCIQKILNPPKKSRRSSKTQNDLDPIEVLTDVFLALMLKSSCYIKSVVESAWKNMSEKINAKSIQIICDAVENTEEFIGGEEDEEGEEENEEMEIEGEEIENEDEKKEDEDEDDDEDEEDEDEEDEDEDENEEMEIDGEVDEDNEDEESEESVALDDEAMFKLDEMIAAVFTKMGNIPKRDLKKLTPIESHMLEFKYKAVSLLDTYVETNPTNPNILLIIMPLIRSIFEKPVSNLQTLFSYRANASLNRLIKIKQYPKGEHLPIDLLHEILEKVYSCIIKSKDNNTAHMLKNTICFVNKILLTSDSGPFGYLDVRKESTYFQNALSEFVASMKSDKKNKNINIELFLDILRRDWRLAFEFFGNIMDVISISSGQLRSILFIKVISNVITKKICGNNKEKFHSVAPSIKKAFIACNSDKHMSPLNRIKCYELMINTFKIMINLFGFDEAKKLWDSEEFVETLSSSKKSQGKVAKILEKLIHYLRTGEPNPTPSKAKSESE